jgi:hypothetical protein
MLETKCLRQCRLPLVGRVGRAIATQARVRFSRPAGCSSARRAASLVTQRLSPEARKGDSMNENEVPTDLCTPVTPDEHAAARALFGQRCRECIRLIADRGDAWLLPGHVVDLLESAGYADVSRELALAIVGVDEVHWAVRALSAPAVDATPAVATSAPAPE